MKWRAIREVRGEASWSGPWRRRYGDALADARADIDPMRSRISTWLVEDQRGSSREISETQHGRGLAEYDDAIAVRDAVGVWG